MKLVRLQEFLKVVKLENVKFKLAALDFGSKNIGVAISDPSKNFALPFKIIKRVDPRMSDESIKDFYSNLTDIIIENSISGIVIGFPIHPISRQFTPLCNEILSILSHSNQYPKVIFY
jgi:RNase H-fold protein (predicted Holliday junction resolvase)